MPVSPEYTIAIIVNWAYTQITVNFSCHQTSTFFPHISLVTSSCYGILTIRCLSPIFLLYMHNFPPLMFWPMWNQRKGVESPVHLLFSILFVKPPYYVTLGPTIVVHGGLMQIVSQTAKIRPFLGRIWSVFDPCEKVWKVQFVCFSIFFLQTTLAFLF